MPSRLGNGQKHSELKCPTPPRAPHAVFFSGLDDDWERWVVVKGRAWASTRKREGGDIMYELMY